MSRLLVWLNAAGGRLRAFVGAADSLQARPFKEHGARLLHSAIAALAHFDNAKRPLIVSITSKPAPFFPLAPVVDMRRVNILSESANETESGLSPLDLLPFPPAVKEPTVPPSFRLGHDPKNSHIRPIPMAYQRLVVVKKKRFMKQCAQIIERQDSGTRHAGSVLQLKAYARFAGFKLQLVSHRTSLKRAVGAFAGTAISVLHRTAACAQKAIAQHDESRLSIKVHHVQEHRKLHHKAHCENQPKYFALAHGTSLTQMGVF